MYEVAEAILYAAKKMRKAAKVADVAKITESVKARLVTQLSCFFRQHMSGCSINRSRAVIFTTP